MRCHRGRAATKQVAPNPLRPKGCRGTAPSAVFSLLDDALRHRRRRDALHRGLRPARDLWRDACALGCVARSGEEDDAGGITDETRHSHAPRPRRPSGLFLGRAPSLSALGHVPSSTPASGLREPAPAQGATRRGPLSGRNPRPWRWQRDLREFFSRLLGPVSGPGARWTRRRGGRPGARPRREAPASRPRGSC